MPRTQEATPETTATAYFLNDQGEVQKADVGSGLYNEARNYGKLFVISQPSKAGDHATLSIPNPYLETVAASELSKVKKLMEKISGSEAGKWSALYDAVGVPTKNVGKAAEKLLRELTEILKVPQPQRGTGKQQY